MIPRQMLVAEDIRYDTIGFSCRTGAGHLASSLSTVEILTVLFREFLAFKVGEPTNPLRDRFILSKGHGCYAYYIILYRLGFIPKIEIERFNSDGAKLTGCVSYTPEYMLEMSTGALGHGLPYAVGLAWSFKLLRQDNKVVCVVGDGEMQEGSNYEALQFALKHRLDNLMIIVDVNRLQACGSTEETLVGSNRLHRIFVGLTEDNCLRSVDGHNEADLRDAYDQFYKNTFASFFVLMCQTTKGKGLELAENNPKYHYRCPVEDGYTQVPR